MDHKGSHLWLIPVIIIGFNSLVFVCLIMIGYKKQTGEAADMRKTAVSESSVSADGDVSGNEAELDESFYDEEEPEEDMTIQTGPTDDREFCGWRDPRKKETAEEKTTPSAHEEKRE